MNALKNFLAISILSLLVYGTANSQDADNPTDNSLQQLVDSVEFILGSDDILVNGKVYIPLHIRASGHAYLGEDTWREGGLSIKGRVYHEVVLKYNIELDRLVLRNKTRAGTFQYVLMNNEFLDSFYIGDKKFINAEKYISGKAHSGFYELIYHGKLSLLVKHKKVYIGEFSKNTPNGKYSEYKPANYIYYKDVLTKVSSKSSLLKYFGPHKAEVKRFMKQHKIRYKKATNTELNELMKYCDQLLY